jgi:branched-chain amino acid transport system substrate-binding protein
MSKTVKTVIGIVVLVLVVWGLSSLGKKEPVLTPAASGPINVGAVISLTGPAAINGLDIKRGMDLAKKDLAAKGVQININYQDDQTDPKQSVGAVQQILAANKPDVFVGPIWSFLLDAAIPVIDQAKVVSFSPCSSSEYINAKSSYVFYGYVRNALKVAPAADWLKQRGAKKVAIVVSKDAWGDSNEKAFNQAVADAGAKVALTERVPFGGEFDSLPTVLTKVKASGADAILWTGYDDGATVFIKKIHELKLNMPVLATDAFKSVTAKGVVALNPNDQVYVFDTPKSSAFADKFKAEYGIAPGECADTAYDGLMILADGAQNHGSVSLADYLRSNVNYNGFAHNYKFDANNDVSGGEWVVRKL